MSATTTGLEVLEEDYRSIELEPLGYPIKGQDPKSDQAKFNGPTIPSTIEENTTESPRNGDNPVQSKWRTAVIIGTVACITLISSMLAGILVVSLPTMARELDLSQDLLLWPASVSALACGCTLLISGSIADVAGGRRIYLIGVFLLAVTSIACGVCRTSIQLILFRAAQGLALSLCLPSSVILITRNIPTGSWRNIAFSCLGAGQPVGFSIGLVIGGVFVDEIGWRYGYYIAAIFTFVIFVVSIFGVPADKDAESQSLRTMLNRMKSEIDWIGCMLLSTSLGLFSYVLSVVSSGASHFLEPASITLFSIATALIPAFVFYVRRH